MQVQPIDFTSEQKVSPICFGKAELDEMLEARKNDQKPLDEIDEASMESFPCSDPPAYTHAHA